MLYDSKRERASLQLWQPIAIIKMTTNRRLIKQLTKLWMEMDDSADEEVDADIVVGIPDEDLLSSHPAPVVINGTTFREFSQNGAP
jgi:hypothetical protein